MLVARLFWQYLKIALMNEAQYRVNFFVQIVQSGIALVTGLVVLSLVFRYTQRLAGWSHVELLAVMGVHILVGGIIKTTIQPSMLRLIEDVREGTLDFILTKPADAQTLVSVREVRLWQAVDIALGMIVLGVAVSNPDRSVSPSQAGIFVGVLVTGALMIYAFWVILTSGAFWLVRMENVVELFQGIYQAGRWPVTVYPEPLRLGLTFLVPVAFAVTVPAEALTARLTLATLLGGIGLAPFFLAVSRVVWVLGLRSYTGASA